MVNVILCGGTDAGKEELLKRIKLVKECRGHHVISGLQKDALEQKNITSTEQISEQQFVDLHKWVIQKQSHYEEEHPTFLSENSVIDSVVQVRHCVNEDEATSLIRSPIVQTSVKRHQEGLVLLLLVPPSSYVDENHQRDCEIIANLYRFYFHFLKIAYLELRSPDIKNRVVTVKEAIKYCRIPLETTRLQRFARGKQMAQDIPYTSNFAFYKAKPEDSKIHVPTISIFEHTYEQSWTSEPEGETNRFIHRHGAGNLMIMSFHFNVKSTTVQSMLRNGVTVNGSLFSFLGCSSKGLKERRCYLWKGSEQEARHILSENGAFEEIPSIPKRMARIGLLFSGVRLTHQKPEQVITVGDIEKNGGCFTDGCGGIGVELAKELYNELERRDHDIVYSRNQTYLPSVYQVRYQGYKGVLALDPTLNANSINVRPSMEKFKTDVHPCIGVCDHSKAHTFGHLNKQFIMLLSGLGVQDDVFLKKQEQYFDDVQEMGKDLEKTVRILQWQNKFDLAQMVLRHQGFDGCSGEIMKSISIVQSNLMSKSEPKSKSKAKENKPKLNILIPESRNIFGVCDQTGTLEYGECFLRITLGNLKQPKTIRGQVVVCKNPCYLLGDVRVLTAVDPTDKPDVEMLNHLVDCIVFPVKGKKPHPHEIAGSDLDGDMFFVTWDKDLLPPETRQPYDYPASNTKPKDKDMISYFSKQQKTMELIGNVSNYFDQWADLEGVNSDKCKNLGMFFSKVIDSGKTGESLTIPPNLKPASSSEAEVKDTKYVWQKLLRKATDVQTQFKRGVIKTHEGFPTAANVSQTFVEEVLSEEFSNITEFEKFTFALNHTNDVEEVLSLYGDAINFALFSREEKCEALLLGVPKEMLENALNWSNLLSFEELAYFKMQTFRHPWSFYFESEHEQFNWKHLLNALANHDRTFIVFDLPDGVTVVLQFLTKWGKGKEQAVTAGTICGFFYSRRFGYKIKYVLGSDYSLDLTEDTLQLYRNKEKTLTFVWLNASHFEKVGKGLSLSEEIVNALSVNLLRFDGSILSHPTKPHPLVNKIPFLKMEIFAHNISGIVPYFDTYDANDVLPVPEKEDQEVTAEEEFVVDTDMMLQCGGLYSVQSEEELIHQLEKAAANVKPAEFRMILDTWKKANQKLPRHVDSCLIQLLEFTVLHVPPMSLPDPVKDELDSLAHSIAYETPEVKCEVLGHLSRLGLEGTAKVICEKYEHILVQRETFLNLINKWQIWWLMENNTAKLFLSKLKVDDEGETVQSIPQNQQIKYLAYFGKLQLLDFLQETSGIKQKMAQSKAENGIFNLKVLKRNDDSDEFLTFWRDYALNHYPQITRGQHVAVFRQFDFRRLPSFRSYCCVAQVVSVTLAPLNIVVKVSGTLPSTLKENTDPNSKKHSLWRLTQLGNVTTHSRIIDALSRIMSTDMEGTEQPSTLSPDLLHLLVQPGGHPQQSPLSEPVPFRFPSNKSGLLLEDISDLEQSLNPQQQRAIRSAVEQKFSLIQGPPGTGKTTVACHIIRTIHSIAEDSKILVVAETNVAVDNIVKKLKDDLFSDILRVGSEGRIDPEVFDVSLEGQLRLLEDREAKSTTYKDKQGMIRRKTKLVENLVRKVRVVLTTCAGAGDPDLKSSNFDFVVVDEATQTKETTLLCSLGHGAKHLIMIGDPQQLGPVTVHEESSTSVSLPCLESLATTLYHRLYNVSGKECVFLATQHRMHPALMKFPSYRFYGGKLESAIATEDPARPKVLFPWPDSKRPLCFINVDSVEERIGTSFYNRSEVNAVNIVLEQILNIQEEDSKYRLDITEIGILTLYQGQVAELRSTIPYPVTVCSVDGFQGREKEVIIVSTVRANEQGNLGFVGDKKRINVLLTRAKRGLIVVGNERTLLKSNIWRNWIQEAPKLDLTTIRSQTKSGQSGRNSVNRGQRFQRGQGHGGRVGGRSDFWRRGTSAGYTKDRSDTGRESSWTRKLNVDGNSAICDDQPDGRQGQPDRKRGESNGNFQRISGSGSRQNWHRRGGNYHDTNHNQHQFPEEQNCGGSTSRQSSARGRGRYSRFSSNSEQPQASSSTDSIGSAHSEIRGRGTRHSGASGRRGNGVARQRMSHSQRTRNSVVENREAQF